MDAMEVSVKINGVDRHLGWRPSAASSIERMHREGTLVFAHELAQLKAAKPRVFQETTCRHFFKEIKDQDGQSSCTGFSAASAMNGTYAKQGFDVNVSAASIYCQINGGRDNGSSVADAMDALVKVGCLPVGFQGIDDLDWSAAYKIRKSAAFLTEAKKLLLLECVFCGDDVDEWMSKLSTGQWAGQFCLGAGRNFDTDSNGWLPTSGPDTGINHALCATGGLAKHPKTGEWGPEGLNSWGAEWGDGGFFKCTEKWLRQPSQELWLARCSAIPV